MAHVGGGGDPPSVVLRPWNAGVSILGRVGDGFAVGLEAIRRTWDVRQWWWEFVEQVWFLARVTTVPVLLVAIPLGVTISLQVGDLSWQLGATSATGGAVVLALVQQVAPLAAAILTAGAGGSAMTADMGARRIRDELAAMEVMGINPIHRLVTPRLWASSVVALLLVPVVILTGVTGGFLYNVVVQEVSPGAFFDGALSLLRVEDLLVTMFRAFVFGMVAGVVACYMGMTCATSPIGVGRAVTQATVVTFILVFALNYTIFILYSVVYPPRLG